MIIDGELDHLPESAFNLKGTIEDEAEKMWQKPKIV
jgi:F-type H+-transporting ATPase subunit beta